jgi:tetratricopeptide (TPR) repeat protein
MAYDALGREAEAEKAFRETIAINPNHFRANLLLGRILGMKNDPQGALAYSRKAVSLEPNSADAHKFLANVYIELGDNANASREQDEARRLQNPSRP